MRVSRLVPVVFLDDLVVNVNGDLYFTDTAGKKAGALSNVEFGGANMDEMCVTNGDKVFKRKTKVKGVVSWRAPVKPAPPRL